MCFRKGDFDFASITMPIKYVGRLQPSFHGKTLWESLCRLKNFGIGRMVYRYSFNQRYAEPSYYIITRVNPDLANLEVIVDILSF